MDILSQKLVALEISYQQSFKTQTQKIDQVSIQMNKQLERIMDLLMQSKGKEPMVQVTSISPSNSTNKGFYQC